LDTYGNCLLLLAALTPLAFLLSPVESTRLVESSIRLKFNIEGGCLQRNSKVYLGTTLLRPTTGPSLYVFTGGKFVSSETADCATAGVEASVGSPSDGKKSSAAVPGMGWARTKSRKCPCCA
jgi:hypothetical protein